MYAFTVRVPAPIAMYDATHAAITEAIGGRPIPGAILHLARATADGFEITEVWETREQCDAFNRDYVAPAMERAGASAPGPEPELDEFEPRSIMTPQVYNWGSTAVSSPA